MCARSRMPLSLPARDGLVIEAHRRVRGRSPSPHTRPAAHSMAGRLQPPSGAALPPREPPTARASARAPSPKSPAPAPSQAGPRRRQPQQAPTTAGAHAASPCPPSDQTGWAAARGASTRRCLSQVRARPRSRSRSRAQPAAACYIRSRPTKGRCRTPPPAQLGLTGLTGVRPSAVEQHTEKPRSCVQGVRQFVLRLSQRQPPARGQRQPSRARTARPRPAPPLAQSGGGVGAAWLVVAAQPHPHPSSTAYARRYACPTRHPCVLPPHASLEGASVRAHAPAQPRSSCAAAVGGCVLV